MKTNDEMCIVIAAATKAVVRLRAALAASTATIALFAPDSSPPAGSRYDPSGARQEGDLRWTKL